jgi:hypothetical protein
MTAVTDSVQSSDFDQAQGQIRERAPTGYAVQEVPGYACLSFSGALEARVLGLVTPDASVVDWLVSSA